MLFYTLKLYKYIYSVVVMCYDTHLTHYVFKKKIVDDVLDLITSYIIIYRARLFVIWIIEKRATIIYNKIKYQNSPLLLYIHKSYTFTICFVFYVFYVYKLKALLICTKLNIYYLFIFIINKIFKTRFNLHFYSSCVCVCVCVSAV